MNNKAGRVRLCDKSFRTAAAVVVATIAMVAAIVAVSRSDTTSEPDGRADVPSSAEAVTTTEQALGPSYTPAWSVDAESAYGREFAAFRSPAAGLMFDSGAYGVVDGGEVLVTAMGLPNPRTYMVDDVKLVGLGVRDGQVQWSVSPGGVDSCARLPVQNEMLCLDSYADVPAIVAIGVSDGAIRRVPLPDGWFPFAIESDGTSVYILEGNPEDSESVLHGGSVDALNDAWTRPIMAFAPWEGVDGTLIHVDGDRGVVTLGGEAEFFDPRTGSPLGGLELQSQSSVVDIATGAEVWQLNDPYAVDITVGQTRYAQVENSIIATGDVEWEWPLPTDSSGFPASGIIVEADSGVYFVDSESIVKLD